MEGNEVGWLGRRRINTEYKYLVQFIPRSDALAMQLAATLQRTLAPWIPASLFWNACVFTGQRSGHLRLFPFSFFLFSCEASKQQDR